MKSASFSGSKSFSSSHSSNLSVTNQPAKTSVTQLPKVSLGKRKRGSRPEQTSVSVLYAPELGPTGLDDGDVITRFQVYCREQHCDPSDPTSVENMDEAIPFFPEVVFYKVFSIKVDGQCIFEHKEGGNFYILPNSFSSTGSFNIVYQSPSCVILPEGGKATPLYCVASTHSLTHTYMWETSEGALSGSTPVLWVNKEGTYKCTVREPGESGRESVSRNIYVYVNKKEVSGGDCTITGVEGPQTQDTLPSYVKGDAMIFSYHSLCDVMDNFSNEKLVGKGGFGRVYRGKLRHIDVAIKVLNTRGMQSIARAKSDCLLQTEVAALTRYRHPNLIALMGFCSSNPVLVYPYMQRESLYKNLHEWKVEEPLSWSQRLSILTDTCRGLAYIHDESPPVIHHDINSSNILLDHKLTAKISDFGFSIQLPQSMGSKTLVTAVDGLPGTDGYRPPEYSDRKFSVLSDMYSYGVVMLECYSGLLAFSDDREANNLVDHTEDDRASADTFRLVSDRKLGPCPTSLADPLLQLINLSTKRVSKKRLPSCELLDTLEAIKV